MPQNYRIQPGISNDFRTFRTGGETVKVAVIGAAGWVGGAVLDFDIMHTPSQPEADRHCNAARSRDLLGLEYRGHFPGE